MLNSIPVILRVCDFFRSTVRVEPLILEWRGPEERGGAPATSLGGAGKGVFLPFGSPGAPSAGLPSSLSAQR
jgi:hypothetical protein